LGPASGAHNAGPGSHTHFPRLQLERAPRPGGASRQQIEFEGPEPQKRFPGVRRTAQQRLEPSDELDEGKGLRKVIVATGAKASDPVVQSAKRTYNQGWRADAFAPKGLDDVQAFEAGKKPIDHQGVETIVRSRESIGSAVCHRHGVAVTLQLQRDLVRGFPIILDKEHLGQVSSLIRDICDLDPRQQVRFGEFLSISIDAHRIN